MDARAGGGTALFCAAQDNGILVEVSDPLHCDADRAGFFADVVAGNVQNTNAGEVLMSTA